MKTVVLLSVSFLFCFFAETGGLRAELRRLNSETGLYLFPEPGSQVLATLSAGSEVEVVQETEAWSLVIFKSDGLRISGKSLYGDAGFTLPIYDDMGGTLKYMPLGIPSLALGILF